MSVDVSDPATQDVTQDVTLDAPAAEATTAGAGPEQDDPTLGGKLVLLFTLHGTDDYYGPKRIGANVALAYLRDLRKHGQEYALAGVLEKTLGPDGFDRLADDDKLTNADMEIAMAAVHQHAMGALEGGGKGPAATKR